MGLQLHPIGGVGEVAPGDDVAALLVDRLRVLDAPLRDGDVVVVTSKVVSKAAGLRTDADRADVVRAGTARVVARHGRVEIVRTHHGLVMAGAGVDASNVGAAGGLLPLPVDPDGDARDLRRRLLASTGRRVAVVVSDTAGRAWRDGHVDVAIGCAGIRPVVDLAGTLDADGRPLAVTAPAVADELAAAADLVAGKAAAVPFVVVRGLDPAWLTDGDGPGSAALVRPDSGDLFGLGARDAVEAAVGASVSDERVPGFPDPPAEVVATLEHVVGLAGGGVVDTTGTHPIVRVAAAGTRPADLVEVGRLAQRLESLLVAYGLGHRVPVEVEV